MLSQVDGHSTLEEIAEIVGLDFGTIAKLAERLAELGAVNVTSAARPARFKKEPSKAPPKPSVRPPKASVRPPKASVRPPKASVRPAKQSMRPRLDPRAEIASLRPAAPAGRASKISVRSDQRTETASSRPKRSVRPEPRKERRSLESLQAPRVPRLDDETCELDDATVAAITGLDAKVRTVDYYAMLDVARNAEKKDIKRAYFSLAAKFHPDRFFGKKIGRLRAPLDRIIIRLTEAHDVLSKNVTRATYDATLPAARADSGPLATQPTQLALPAEPRRPSRRLSKGLGRTSKQLKAVRMPTPANGSGATRRNWPPPVDEPPPSSAVGPAPPVTAVTAVAGVTGAAPPRSDSRFRRAYAAAKQIKAQEKVEVFVKAADEALRKEDVIGAANHFRLALQNSDDPLLRERFEVVDKLAKTARFDKSLVLGRAAERDQRWVDAALHYTRAYDARPDAATADRAATALRKSNGDLHRAAALAESAIALEPRNVAYHVTLGETYLAANLLTRASAALARALELAPRDVRAQELAEALANEKK